MQYNRKKEDLNPFKVDPDRFCSLAYFKALFSMSGFTPLVLLCIFEQAASVTHNNTCVFFLQNFRLHGGKRINLFTDSGRMRLP